ncbi:MAG: EF-hand domain-containing protein [Pseudomonadota bacterium]
MRIISLAAVALALSAGPVLAQPAGPRADANGDGKVSLAEFKAARVGMMMRGDANKDGKLTKAELEAGAARMREAAAARGREAPGGGRGPGMMFTMMDANKDGFLTRPEIETMIERRFRRLDVNGDGSLSDAEMQAARPGPMGGAGGGGS